MQADIVCALEETFNAIRQANVMADGKARLPILARAERVTVKRTKRMEHSQSLLECLAPADPRKVRAPIGRAIGRMNHNHILQDER